MKKIFLVGALLVLSFALRENAVSQDFPLDVGSMWGYKFIDQWHQDDSTDLVITAERVIKFNGEKYVRFDQYLFGFWTIDNPAFREDQLGQVHVLLDNEDQVLYKFHAFPGDTWEVNLGHVTATVTRDWVSRFFSFFVGPDCAWKQWFSLDQGLVCQENIGFAGASYFYLTYIVKGSNPYVMALPCSLKMSLPANKQSTQSLVLYNNGDSAVSFIVSETQSSPPHMPDLLVSGGFPGLPPGGISIPELHWVTIKIANCGLKDAKNVECRSIFSNLSERTDTIPTIPACSTTYITTSYWFDGPPPQWADVTVDPNNLIEESNENNNNAQVIFFPYFWSYNCSVPDVAWLSATPNSGTIASAESTVVQVEINTTGLSEGDYTAFLLINCSSPIDTQLVVPVQLTVTNQSSTDTEETQAPVRFEVSQNYPNPFNPQTVIQYSISQNCFVEATIYNLLGQKARTLVNESQTMGQKTIVWDGRSDNGEEMPSGVYFLRVEANGLIQSRKMVLLK
jgi:hypothetical protein